MMVKLRDIFSGRADPNATGPELPYDAQSEKDPVDVSNNVARAADGETLVPTGQDGVKKALATTIAWSRTSLIVTYALIFLIFFVNSLEQQISNNVLAYVTSAFKEHSLTATTNIFSQLTAGIFKLPVAKFMDIWGRPQGFILMLVCAVVGLVLMAACGNVETYAAAQTFYWVGFDGIAYVLDVFIADTSSLEWRGLALAFSTSPYIVTTWAGPSAAQSFVKTSGWRWAYGTFAIVTPVISLPFLLVFLYNQKRAREHGILVKTPESSHRTWTQSVLHYFIEFDVVGIVLLCAGWSVFLLPFDLATSSAQKWRSGYIIAMLVVGVVLLVAFGIYERFFAPKSFIPFRYLGDRTVFGSCFLAATSFVSFYCWDSYFTSYLQVVHNLSIAHAGYVDNIYSIGSTFWALVVGLLIPWSGRFKWLALCAVPLQLLGTGLMIYFRQPDWGIGYVVMCQIFIAFAGGTLEICQQIAIMAAVGPENVAVALAVQAVFSSVGGAIGSSISGAIWTNTFLANLELYLPPDVRGQALEIYEDINTQLSYAWGTPARDAIIRAYGDSQRDMCIAATSVLALSFFWVLIWKDIHVKDFKKPAGATMIG